MNFLKSGTLRSTFKITRYDRASTGSNVSLTLIFSSVLPFPSPLPCLAYCIGNLRVFDPFACSACSRQWATCREDMPSKAKGVTGPGRVQDPLHFDVAYQGAVCYHPQQLVGASDSHYVPPSLLYILAIEPYICILRCRTRPKYPGPNTTQRSSGFRLMFPRILDTYQYVSPQVNVERNPMFVPFGLPFLIGLFTGSLTPFKHDQKISLLKW